MCDKLINIVLNCENLLLESDQDLAILSGLLRDVYSGTIRNKLTWTNLCNFQTLSLDSL